MHYLHDGTAKHGVNTIFCRVPIESKRLSPLHTAFLTFSRDWINDAW